MSGRRSRTKGAAFERELARRWRESGLYPAAERGLRQTRAGNEVPDVDNTPWWIEAKHRKAMNVRAAMRQAEAATDGRLPVVVARYHGDGVDKSLVVMRLDDWERVVSWYDAHPANAMADTESES